MAGDIKFVILVDDKGTATIRDFDKALDDLGKTAGTKTHSALGSLWKQMALGSLVADGVRKVLGTIKDELLSTVTAGMEGEKAQRGLELALATTGRTVSAMLPGLTKFADELMKETIYDDEAAKGAMALLAQLTNLDSQGLKRATQGAAGLATVFRMDLESAATLVAKAMTGNTAALSRYGIRVAEDLPLQEKQNELLSQLGMMFERAKGETDTFGGALAQLKNSYGELKESVGTAIIQNQAVKDGIKNLKEWVDKLTQSDDFKVWLSIIIEGFTKAVELAGKFAGACKDLTEKVFGASKADKEFAESQEKLNAAIERARDAGHDLGNKVKGFVGPLQESKTVVNETGTAFHEMAEKIKEVKDSDFVAWQKKLGDTITDFVLPAQDKYIRLQEDSNKVSYAFTDVLKRVADETKVSEATVLQFLWNVRADFLSTMGVMIPKWGDFSAAAETTTRDTSNWFDGLMTDIARGFGDTIEKWVSGASTFRDFMKGIWGSIKDAFFSMIGEMVTKWTTDFLTGVLSSTKKTLSSVVDAAGSVVKGVADVLSGGLASGIGSFLGTFFGTLLGGGGGLGKTEGNWIHEIRDRAYDIMHTVDNAFANLEDIRANYWPSMTRLLDGIWGTEEDVRRNLWPRLLDALKPLENMKSAQGGLDMIASRPQLVMVHAQERITVTPGAVNVQPGQTVINLDGRTLALALAPYMTELERAGVKKTHTNSLVSY